MKGYKAFNEDLTCRGFQYEIGKEYTFDGEPIPCKQGFHFCATIADCYEYYPKSEQTRICEVEATGDIEAEEPKYCTNKIRIVAEVTEEYLRKANTNKSSSGYCNSGDGNSGDRNSGNWNSGDGNSGYCNSGDRNSGDRNSGNSNSGNRNSGDRNSGNRNSGDMNSGYCNSGDRNSGYCNSGDMNSGDRNSGNSNSGDRNSGDRNSGYCNSGDMNSGDWNSGNSNSGDRNSGDWNSGYCNSGVFCTDEKPTIKLFDKPSDWTFEKWRNSNACYVMRGCPYTHSDFIDSCDMSEEEKERHPEYKTIGGYVKTFIVTNENKQSWWNGLQDEERAEVMALPNFDAEKFEKCTGIRVEG